MDPILIALCAPLALIVLWFAWALPTWYFADNQKVFDEWKTGRVTFKEVLVRGADDFWHVSGLAKLYDATRKVIAALWLYWAPRLTDRTILAALFTDLSLAASGQNVWIWIAQHPLVALIVLAINLFAATPRSAPDRLVTQ